MSYTIDTSELRKLAADLDLESARVGRDVAQAVRESGERVRDDAKGRAPVRTGKLAGSIGVDTYGDGRSAGMTVVVGPSEHYGLFVERGTSKMAPEPFMGPAFEAEAPKLEAAIADIAGTVLQ